MLIKLAHKQQGMGLIEIMIGVVLSLLLFAGLINLLVSNKRTYLLEKNLSELQRNGQFTTTFLNRTIRLAGFRTIPAFSNQQTFSDYQDLFPAGSELIFGSDNTTNNSDSITIRFQGNNTGNIFDCLAGPVNQNQIAESTFFISANDELMCAAVNNGVANPNSPEVLVDGVQAMEIRYGEDLDADAIVDHYVPASSGSLDYNRVISVRISLLLRTSEPVNPVPDSKTYALQDVTVGPFNDNFLRRVYTTTIHMRNMSAD